MAKAKSAYFYLIVTILLWSATPAIAKIALREIDSFQLLFYTSIVSVLSLYIVNYYQGKLNLLLTYKKSDYFLMFGMGFLGIFLYSILLYTSFSLAPAGQVNVVNYLWPVFIVIFSIPILKEKYNYKTILAIILSFIGALIAFTKGSLSSFSNEYAGGYLLAALGAVCYGLFSVLGKKYEYDKYSSMLVYNISAVILIIPTALMASGFIIPKSLSTIIAIIVLGGIINSITFVFWFKALNLGNTHKIANIIYVVPFLAMVWTYLFNSEIISYYSVIGLILIVFGIIIQVKNNIA